ncbi:hypothetical protein JIR23_13225 [Bradyrhizobium diazoefficiens]|nr:hypothetical protein [Bradyrhizobium diazoefficiens]QQN66580.1 hypothetical protein JIR23_13225 [Bradyrhizobium diazoefficiens]
MVSLIVAIARSHSTAPPGLNQPVKMFHHHADQAHVLAQMCRDYVVDRSDTML